MLEYPALFELDRKAGGFVVTFPDFSFGATQGETPEEAMLMAADLLKILIADRIEKNEELPKPRVRRGSRYRVVSLPALQAAKASLYQAWWASGLGKSELARRLGIPKSNVDRLFDLDHHSRLSRLEAAFAVLNKKMVIEVRSAA
jgi:antitoxin HicB